MYGHAQGLSSQGTDLIHLEVGRPDFDTPTHIKEATKRALDNGIVHYGDFAGDVTFRQALANKLLGDNKITATENEVIVVNGLTHAANTVCMAALNPGDEVILLEPYYPQHIGKVELAGATPVFVALDKDNDFAIDGDAIEAKITPNTKMIILVNPANPTGRVYRRDELNTLASIAIKHDLLVMSDEVYEKIVYCDEPHISIASLPGMRERTISLFAFTKIYAMDGWRLGYLTADATLIPALLQVTMNDVAHVNVFVQHGGLAAVSQSQDCVSIMLAEDQRRRDMVVERLNAMPGVSCPLPQATIYAFPNITATGLSSDELALNLLHDCHVVVESGAFYGATGEGYLRICFGSESYQTLELAMDKLDRFFTDLKTNSQLDIASADR